ncbi:MAG TPA: D-alanyl-D-alanine carboxypeptidase/D-alanyl-D-alanine-endopeptidase [Nocardioides sp.]|uniref:D-alanyl-D-alanine carboxypeptidase/D-alanyl-D-alanine endopeptidase n=1 Tax=Nocardioides sp. TaxID=35761 RepID=UPI002D7EB1D7|nr:D-alanyl-D-alanine carboxypeptidase/D-alanyl-D-alanine-endopeptidase [Nocardioides sp.]HET6651066.1 D-alanyl-D-alanine carboxypeptidase/D-alanyl-D-alanine-endopeptidase [Nocardioides sp.]
MSRLTNVVLGLTTAALTATGGHLAATAQAPTAPAAQTQTASTAQGSEELGAAIDTILADPRFQGSMVSVAVRDAGTGEPLYERDVDRRLNPASNMKLFSSAAAMDALGPDYRFGTDLLADGVVRGGNLKSDLYLRGGGDPTLLADDYRELARQLAAAGVDRVEGDVVADDSFFDDVPLATAWSWDDEPFYYSAVTSALTVAPDTDYDSGTVIVRTQPGGAAGDQPVVSLQPQTDAVRVDNRATTGPAGSGTDLTVEREHASDRVVVTGSIAADASTNSEWVTVPEPTAYAGDVLARALDAEGIRLSGRVEQGRTPQGARVLASHQSMSLQELLTPFMKLSNNMHAEALVKTMGREATGTGSWGAGLDVVRAYAQRVGVDTSSLRISDGSGLSRFDLLSADHIADLLTAVRAEPWFQAWFGALPVAGNPDRFTGGTLRSRMRNTPAADNLHGKTGSMTSVTALSGYVTNADGRELVFSMVSNNFLQSPRSAEDALGVTLASWSEDDAEAPTVSSRSLGRSTDYGPADLECSWAKAC